MATWYFPLPVLGPVNCPFTFVLIRTISALINNILQYSHLVTFWGQFLVSLRCNKWYKLVSVQNGSSATSSFLWYRSLFDFSTTQSPVWPALCSLSGVTLSLAEQQYDPEIILPHPGFFLLLNQRLMDFCTYLL